MKLSIIIPVFNEEKTIKEIIRRVVLAPTLDYQKEIIVINDGSTDKTKKILKELKKEFDFIFLTHSQNLGKGSAIKTGLKYATGNYAIIQDADLEYNPDDLPKLLKALDKTHKAIYGSRNLEPREKSYFYCAWGVKFLTFLTNLLFGAKLTDIFTCYKLIPTDLFKSLDLTSSRFEIEAEITAKILKSGYKIKEVAISYFPRSYKEGKKIRIRDGLKSIWIIIKNRF